MSLNIKPSRPSVSDRRGRQLAPLQTNFSRPTSQIVNVASPITQRPRPSDYDNGKTDRVPLQPARVKRQSSRSSLLHIFSREKSVRKSDDNTKLSGIEEVQDQTPRETMAAPSPTPAACDTPRAAATSTPNPATPSVSTDMSRSKLRQNHGTKTDGDGQPPAEDVAWKPPPLFKAYPQGLKHTTLPAPALSGDSIMRLHATFKARGVSLQDDNKQAHQGANEEPLEESTTRKKKLDKEKQKYQRALSDNIENGEWTQKVYIIATAGYILQYAGDGKHDRLPEKMLLLGPKSVAFASDAIPGKHWVLQVSQGSEDSSTNSAETPKPIFSRFGFHRSHTRRLAQNLLLVFGDPEEMSSWLLAIRAQIEARGGKKYVSEKVYDKGMESQLRSKPSMRQMVRKDPTRFSAVFLQPRQSTTSEDKDSSSVGDQSRRSSYISVHRRSMVMHPPPESRSGSVSTAQTDVMSNAEEPGHFYPALGLPPPPDGSVISDTASSITGPTSPTFSSPRKRQSMFLPQVASSEVAEIPRAQPTVPDAHFRSTSPPAPNFSVPLFSKRFAARQDIPQVPHLPSAHGDNQRDDTSIDTISMFSSPPQSPSQDGFNAPPDTREQRRPLDRRDQAKKQLRTSTSEDVLGNMSRNRDRSRLCSSNLPEHIAMAPDAFSSPRPVPPIKPVMPTASSHPPMPLAEASRRDQSNRTDAPSRPSSIVMSRRKSLNGLTIGPPAAPPPSCPLPKIPFAFVEPPAQSAWPEHSPPMSPVEDAEKAIDAITPLAFTHNHRPRTTRSATSRENHKV
ncbi:hypothetical protein BDW62DRAFT_70080 [Aspergillus aurantiobrunneus]